MTSWALFEALYLLFRAMAKRTASEKSLSSLSGVEHAFFVVKPFVSA